MKRILSGTIIILFITFAVRAFAEMEVPASLQVALFYKIFDFDQTLTGTTGQEIVIGIFYNPQDSQSKQDKEEIIENFSRLSAVKIGDASVVTKEITSVDQLHDINIVYVTSGNDPSISEIIEKCHMYKILSISGVEKYVREGLGIAIKLENRRPKIIINRASAELSGAVLSSKILSLAQII